LVTIKLKKQNAKTLCYGTQQPLNKLTDLFRIELAQVGFIECLTMALLTVKDNFLNMNKNESLCVKITESKTSEFEIFRTSLMPGMFKTIEANKSVQLPFKIFEISDIVLLDEQSETGARNHRRLSFAYSGLNSGFEVIHGVIDHLMDKLGLTYNDKVNGYHIVPSSDSSFFPDRQANLFIKGTAVGIFGIAHPKVLYNFKIHNPVSIAEIDIEFIINLIIKGELLKSKK